MKTIKDVAALAQVSVVTVSRVINTPHKVSEERRKRVLDAIEALGYTPNNMARSLVTKSTNVIGVLLPDITNTFSPIQVDSIADEADKAGYSILLGLSGDGTSKEERMLELMDERRVDGLILLGARLLDTDESSTLSRLARRIPVVTLAYTSDVNMFCVRCDEASGTSMAVEYLASLGHKRIAMLNGRGAYSTYHYKEAGYRRAMRQLGLPVPTNYCLHVPPYYDGGFQGLAALLQEPDPPTAIITAGDQLAQGVYLAAQAKGLRIPDDLSVVGFSNTPISAYLQPPLTTVDQFGAVAARKAVKLMVDVLEGKPIASRAIIERPKLVVRKSCRRI